MTDDERRRSSDPRIDAIEIALAEIAKNCDDVDEIMSAHVSHYHAFTADELRPMVEEHNELAADVPQIRSTVERIIDALDGRETTDLHGVPMDREVGLIEKVDNLAEATSANAVVLDLLDHRTNGGVTITQNVKRRTPKEWTRSEKIAAGSLGGFLFFSALPGIVITVRWLANLIVEAGL